MCGRWFGRWYCWNRANNDKNRNRVTNNRGFVSVKRFQKWIYILDNSCIIYSYLCRKWVLIIATSKIFHVKPTHSAETALFWSSRDRIIKSLLCVAGNNFESHSFDAEAIMVRNGKEERFHYRDDGWVHFCSIEFKPVSVMGISVLCAL